MMPRFACLLLLGCSTIYAASAQTLQGPEVVPGSTVRLVVAVPNTTPTRPAPVEIRPADGVTIRDISTTVLPRIDEVRFTANIPPHAAPGTFAIATLVSTPRGGPSILIHCYVRVRAQESSEAETTSTSQLPRAELTTVPQRPDAPASLPPIPSLTAATPALPDVQQLPAPLLPPVEQGFSNGPAAVVPPAGRESENTLQGLMYAGATELAPDNRSEADVGFGIDLSGRVGSGGSTQVNAVYVYGWNPGLSPVLRYGLHRSRGHLRVRAPAWSFEGGEIRPENPFAGGVTRADGASLQKTNGLLIGSITAGRPKYFAGGWGGHLVQASVGVGFNAGSVSLIASDAARPVQTSRVRANPAPREDSEQIVEDLARVGELLSGEDRLRSGGVETRLKFGGHNIMARAGWLDLVGLEGERASGPVIAGTYTFAGRHGSFNGQVRNGPPSVPGTALMGDLVTLGGKVTVVGPFALIGRAYRREFSLLGRDSPTRSSGAVAGIEYSKGQARFHLHGNYRELRSLHATVTRSISAGLRLPIGVFGIDTAAEYGEADDRLRRRSIASYRGSLYVEVEKASIMLSGSYRDYGVSSPRVSLDLSGSVEWRGATFEGGTGVSRAGIFGDVFNAWTTLDFPLPGNLSILLGADYDRWSFADSPYLIFLMDDDSTPPLRFTVNVRRKLSVPIPVRK